MPPAVLDWSTFTDAQLGIVAGGSGATARLADQELRQRQRTGASVTAVPVPPVVDTSTQTLVDAAVQQAVAPLVDGITQVVQAAVQAARASLLPPAPPAPLPPVVPALAPPVVEQAGTPVDPQTGAVVPDASTPPTDTPTS